MQEFEAKEKSQYRTRLFCPLLVIFCYLVNTLLSCQLIVSEASYQSGLFFICNVFECRFFNIRGWNLGCTYD